MKLYVVEGRVSPDCLGRAPKGIILVDEGERQVAPAVTWAHSEVETPRASWVGAWRSDADRGQAPLGTI